MGIATSLLFHNPIAPLQEPEFLKFEKFSETMLTVLLLAIGFCVLLVAISDYPQIKAYVLKFIVLP